MHALKAEVEHLKEHATYLARQVNEVSRERDTLKVEIERLKDRHERDQEELGELDVKLIFAEAHVRTLRAVLESALSLDSHINCVCGRGFSRLPAVIKSAARAALAATDEGVSP